VTLLQEHWQQYEIKMTCALTNFKLPDPDVRLIIANDTVYKIKLRFRADQTIKYGTPNNEPSFWKQGKVQYDIERVILYVLHNQSNIEPIRTDQLVIYPYKKEWPNASKLYFTKFDECLKTSSHLFLFFIERISNDDLEPLRKKKKEDKIQSKFIDEQDIHLDEKQSYYDLSSDGETICENSVSDSSDVDDSFDSSIYNSPKNAMEPNNGYVNSLFNFLMTPMKKIRKFWK